MDNTTTVTKDYLEKNPCSEPIVLIQDTGVAYWFACGITAVTAAVAATPFITPEGFCDGYASWTLWSLAILSAYYDISRVSEDTTQCTTAMIPFAPAWSKTCRNNAIMLYWFPFAGAAITTFMDDSIPKWLQWTSNSIGVAAGVLLTYIISSQPPSSRVYTTNEFLARKAKYGDSWANNYETVEWKTGTPPSDPASTTTNGTQATQSVQIIHVRKNTGMRLSPYTLLGTDMLRTGIYLALQILNVISAAVYIKKSTSEGTFLSWASLRLFIDAFNMFIVDIPNTQFVLSASHESLNISCEYR